MPTPKLKCKLCRHNKTCTQADIHEDGDFPGCGISIRDPKWRGDDPDGRRRKRKTPSPEEDEVLDDLPDA
jgi:hypothetical protein